MRKMNYPFLSALTMAGNQKLLLKPLISKKLRSVFFLFCLSFFSARLQATTYTFVGFFGGTSWSSSWNWSGGIKPPATVPAGDIVNLNTACNIDQAVVMNGSLNCSGNYLITIASSFTIGSGGSFSVPSIAIANTGTLTVSGSFWINNLFTNNGSFIINRNTGFPFQLTNNGTLTINSGASLAIYKTGLFTGGIGNYGNVTVNTNGSLYMSETYFFGASASTLNNNGLLSASGTGGSFGLNGSLTNNGMLDVGSGASFGSTGPVTNTATGLIKGDGSFSSVSYTGSSGSVINPGSVTHGRLNIAGSFNAGSTTYQCNISGTAQGVTYDWIAAAGNINISNAGLQVFWNFFTPQIGQSFTILTCASRTGQFASVNIPPVAGRAFTVVYNPTSVVINVSALLPVRLLNFTGSVINNTVQLNWKTENEQNTSHFEIEKSNNAAGFAKIDAVSAVNAPGTHQYSFADTQPHQGANYYRLKQIDIDGRFDYSNIISVSVKDNRQLFVYPNPAANKINIHSSQQLKDAAIQIINSSGGVLLEKKNLSGRDISLDLSGIPKGIYMLKLITGNKSKTSILFTHQ